jgi:uncharacterized membrane protein
MSDERYAPPTAPLGDSTRERGTGRIDLGEAFREAWAATWANFPLLLGVSLMLGIVALLSALTVVGIFLVLPVLAWGGFRFALNVIDGSAEAGDLFSGFSEYGRTLGAMLLLMILMALLYLVGQSLAIVGQLAGSALLTFVGMIANLVWSLGVMPRLAFVWYYVVDQGLGAPEAVQTSWEATRDQKLTCLLLGVVSGLIPVIGVLFLLVGVIPALMISTLMQAAAYRQLAGR